MSLFNFDDIVSRTVGDLNPALYAVDSGIKSKDLHSKFEKIVMGQLQYRSDSLGCNMLISRMQRTYSNQPTTAQLDACVKEMESFFDKYSSIMSADMERISTLPG